MILGVFPNRDQADKVIDDLIEQDYDPKEISVIMRDINETREIHEESGVTIAGSAASGAATGGVIGGIAGLLVGLGAIAVPGIGALFIAGPIASVLGLTGAAATTVSGAITGALAGGLVGALVGLGLPENEARVYEERIRSGEILVAVPAREGEEEKVKSIFENHKADQIRSVNMKRDSVE
jgi:hypothetical protein